MSADPDPKEELITLYEMGETISAIAFSAQCRSDFYEKQFGKIDDKDARHAAVLARVHQIFLVLNEYPDDFARFYKERAVKVRKLGIRV